MGRKVLIKRGSGLFQNSIQILPGRTKENQDTTQLYETVNEWLLNAIESANNFYNFLERLEFRIIMKIFMDRLENVVAVRSFGLFTFDSNENSA